MRHSLNVRSPSEGRLANTQVSQLILKMFVAEVESYTFSFAFSVHLVEGSSAVPDSIWKVIVCMNLFWHLFLPSLFYFINCQGAFCLAQEPKM